MPFEAAKSLGGRDIPKLEFLLSGDQAMIAVGGKAVEARTTGHLELPYLGCRCRWHALDRRDLPVAALQRHAAEVQLQPGRLALQLQLVGAGPEDQLLFGPGVVDGDE